MDDFIFNVMTPLGFSARTSADYWNKLISKHPEIAARLDGIRETLAAPTQIRKSKSDEYIFLFYSKDNKYWICVVVKNIGGDGFVVTAYITDSIKEGELVWPK